MSRLMLAIVIASLAVTSASPMVTAQVGQPDIIQEHWYHTYTTLTLDINCLLYTSPSPRDRTRSRMPSSA